MLLPVDFAAVGNQVLDRYYSGLLRSVQLP